MRLFSNSVTAVSAVLEGLGFANNDRGIAEAASKVAEVACRKFLLETPRHSGQDFDVIPSTFPSPKRGGGSKIVQPFGWWASNKLKWGRPLQCSCKLQCCLQSSMEEVLFSALIAIGVF